MTAPTTLRVNSQIAIPRREFQFTFVRSSGPGGQNVNKVASKAVLRWSVVDSPSLPDAIRARFIAQCARRMNERGELVLSSQRSRDQSKNIDDCLEKVRALVATAAVVPKKRKKTRVPKSSRESRLREKRVASQKKQRRGRPSASDD
jgi:ribosome-associated protein